MTLTQLKQSIGEISGHLKVVADLRQRAYDGRVYEKGAYADLEEIGLDTSLIYKSALVLEEQLTYQLKVANQTYKLMKQVNDMNDEEWLEENHSK